MRILTLCRAAATVLLLLGAPGVALSKSFFEPHMTIAPGGKGSPRVALTLDACDGKVDERILAALVEQRIPATFFVTARWIARNPQAMKVLLQNADLFEVENHGARHVPAIDSPMRVYGLEAAGSPQAVQTEVEGGARAVKAATNHDPAWFRGAAAVYTDSSVALIKSLHFKVAGFSVAADGGAMLGAGPTARRVEKARDGDVILVHANHPERPAGSGVVTGITDLKKRGYSFVRLDSAPPASADEFVGG